MIQIFNAGKEEEAIHYDDKAVADLLDRSKEGLEQKESWANEYLSSFKVASYATKEGEDVRVNNLFFHSPNKKLNFNNKNLCVLISQYRKKKLIRK